MWGRGDGEDQAKEERLVGGLTDPRRLKVGEVEKHNLQHMPYRNWCPICVQARGRDADHRKVVDQERDISEYSFDSCFPGDELGHQLAILVGKERVSGMRMAVTIPTKASTGKFGTDCALEFMGECGE